MARLPRIDPAGIPEHVIQRGNNRQACFKQGQDYAIYANYLAQYADEFSVSIHAWVFMTNHVHLLLTPSFRGGVSKMMQALGRRYVRYFNRRNQRSGTLWEGRFRASLVESERYFLTCQRYIELNPVRAGMVEGPSRYRWSSYHCHALGEQWKMHSPHEQYLNLHQDTEARLAVYRELVSEKIDTRLIDETRAAVNKGLALGSDRFKEEIEALYGRRVTAAQMGRPLIDA